MFNFEQLAIHTLAPINWLLPHLRALAHHLHLIQVKVMRKPFAVLASVADICAGLYDVPVVVSQLQVAVSWRIQRYRTMRS